MRNYKIYFCLILLSVVLSLPSIGKAAYPTKNFIAVVDVQKVLQDAAAAIDIRDQIKKKRDQYQDDITEQEESLRIDEQKLSEQRSLLSPEAFEEKRKEFKEKLIKVQRDVQVKRSKLDASLNESIGQIQEVVFEIIDDLASERGFRMAVPTSQILYADKELNITDEVLKRLDKKLPTITLTEE